MSLVPGMRLSDAGTVMREDVPSKPYARSRGLVSGSNANPSRPSVTFWDVPLFRKPDESFTVLPLVSSNVQCPTVAAVAAAGAANAAAIATTVSMGIARLIRLPLSGSSFAELPDDGTGLQESVKPQAGSGTSDEAVWGGRPLGERRSPNVSHRRRIVACGRTSG